MMLLNLFVTMVTVATTSSGRCMCHWNCCSELCQKVLFWIFVLTVCSASNLNSVTSASTEDVCNTISPREAYFLEGEDIVFTCSGKDADSLTFVRGKNSEEVPEEFIYTLNESTIKLEIPNVTAKDIDSLNYSTPYKCVNKYNKTCYDNVHVRLEYYPREPEDLECRDYDFDQMTCTWSLRVDYHNKINVTCDIANFMFKSDYEKAAWAPCPEQTQTSCHWNSDEYLASYKMYAKVSVTVRNITKETVKQFFQHDIVEPGPVKELKVRKTIKEGRCVELDWQPTKKHRSFKFILTYTSDCTVEKQKVVHYYAGRKLGEEEWGNRTICGLTPYTMYTYSVKGRLIEEKEVDNKTFVERGYWSNPTIHTDRTNSDAIDVNPVTASGLYKISSITRSGKQGYDLLDIYWTPLTDCDLHDAADSVTYTVTAYNKTISVKHPAFMAQIDVPQDKIINITLQASNSIGHPDSKTVVTAFPEMFGASLSELIVQYNNTDQNCVTRVDVVVTENGTSFTDLSHTLVWCEGTQRSCKKIIKWEKLGVNVTSFVLPGNQCDVDHRYGLVTHGYNKGQGQIVNTGIHWEACIYQLGKVVDRPVENFHLSNIQPDNGFLVEWTPFSCADMKAYITHYQVMYCIGKGQHDCTCTKDKVSVSVSRQAATYTVSDLQSGSLICIWVRGVSLEGVGPANTKPLVHMTSTKSGTLSIVLIVLAGCAAPALALILVVCCCIRKKWKRKRRELSNIRIPESQHEHLLETQPDRNKENGANDEDNGRKYSLGDITDALLENIQPEDSDRKDSQYNTLPSNTSTGHPSHTFIDTFNVSKQDCSDTPEQMRDVATCVVPSRDLVEPGHCRYSISSVLSDFHTEHDNHSLEDLFDTKMLESIAGESVELQNFLSPSANFPTADNEETEELDDMYVRGHVGGNSSIESGSKGIESQQPRHYIPVKDMDNLLSGENKSALSVKAENENDLVKENDSNILSDTKDTDSTEIDLSNIDGSVESLESETDKTKEGNRRKEFAVKTNSGGETEKNHVEQVGNNDVVGSTMTLEGSDTPREQCLPNGIPNSLDNSGALSELPYYVTADLVVKDCQNEKNRSIFNEQRNGLKDNGTQSNSKPYQMKQVICHENGKKNGTKTDIQCM